MAGAVFPSLLILLFSAAATAAAQGEEKQTLLRIKSYWKDPGALTSWSSSSSSSHCSWFGVTCSGGAVTNITLRYQGIEGNIPSFICDLKSLSTIDLYYNSIGGPFPEAALSGCANLLYLDLSQNLLVGPLPYDIDRILPKKLQYLNLNGNNFTGDIPASVAAFPELRELHLDNNLFNGTYPSAEIASLENLEVLTLAFNSFIPTTLPAEFGKLTKLTYFWMSKANLVGDIPDSFKNLTLLEHLDLARNNLTGTIPDYIWNLKNLRNLYLFQNKFHGELPAKIGALGLVEIDISFNQLLSGSIPEDFGRLQKLEVLFLYYNNFSGPIPTNISRITSLYDIRLFNNSLTGPIPPELGKHSYLWNLELAWNKMSGEIPQDLCANGNLLSLSLFTNNFTGSIPASLGRCPPLKAILIFENSLSGDVPAGIWSLANLSQLEMHDNRLSGEIPDRLPWNLTRLQVGNNRLSGRIPSKAGRLVVFKASNNLFSGELPRDFAGIASLQELALDGNELSGEIPPSIAGLSYLTSLNLSRNQLTGSIPEAIGSFQGLTYLDLSINHLSGAIPANLGALRLNILNLSSNSLAGEVPPSLQNGAYDQSFLSNPGLCSAEGKPVLNLPACGSRSAESGGLSKGLFVLFVVLGILVFLGVTFFVAFAVRDLRRRRDAWDRTKWKTVSFQILSFTENMIVRRLTPENLVGSGGSGLVYRVELGNREGEVVAAKKIWSNRKKMGAKLEEEFLAEAEILGSIRHRNIVKLLCCISNDDSKLLVYEYMENGSLHQWLHGKNRRRVTTESGRERGLDWGTRLDVAVGAARGLCYMHHECNPPIIHRDVKSSNILLDAEFRAKVADFGLARILANGGEPHLVTTMAGSLGYMAPECGYSKRVSEKADVYSFGVVLLELTTGREAAGGGGDRSLAEWAWGHFQEGGGFLEVVDKEIREGVVGVEEEVGTVMRLGLMCTGTLPSTRPTMKDVLNVLLRCASAGGRVRDKDGKEYDEVGAVEAVLKKGRSGRSRRKRSGAVDDYDDGTGLICSDV